MALDTRADEIGDRGFAIIDVQRAHDEVVPLWGDPHLGAPLGVVVFAREAQCIDPAHRGFDASVAAIVQAILFHTAAIGDAKAYVVARRRIVEQQQAQLFLLTHAVQGVVGLGQRVPLFFIQAANHVRALVEMHFTAAAHRSAQLIDVGFGAHLRARHREHADFADAGDEQSPLAGKTADAVGFHAQAAPKADGQAGGRGFVNRLVGRETAVLARCRGCCFRLGQGAPDHAHGEARGDVPAYDRSHADARAAASASAYIPTYAAGYVADKARPQRGQHRAGVRTARQRTRGAAPARLRERVAPAAALRFNGR